MRLRSLLERVGILKKREEKVEEREKYTVIFEDLTPGEYLDNIKRKKGIISDITKFSDIHDLLQEKSLNEREKEELSKLG